MSNKIILLIGSQSVGDTLCAIPTIKYFHRIYEKNIHVFTYQPDLFKNFPYITLVDNTNTEPDDLLIETFQVNTKFIHNRIDIRQVHALSTGFQLLPEEMEMEFYPNTYIPIENLPENYVVVHPTKTWPSRSWAKNSWQELINKLNDNDIPVVAIGKDSTEVGYYNINKPVYDINIKNGLNLINKIDIHQSWHVLNKSKITVVMDSGILHLAGTTDTNIIQLGSSINPKFRAPYRKGSQDYKYSYVLGGCSLFCGSDLKYGIKEHGIYSGIPPISFCLENPQTTGQDVEPDPNIYKCQPTVNQVFDEIMKNFTSKITINQTNNNLILTPSNTDIITNNQGKLKIK